MPPRTLLKKRATSVCKNRNAVRKAWFLEGEKPNYWKW